MSVSPETEIWLATFRARLKAETNGSLDASQRRDNFWPPDGRCAASNFVAILFGVDCADFARVWFSRGPESAKRIRTLIKEALQSPMCARYMREVGIHFDPRGLFNNVVFRLPSLAIDHKIIPHF
jgi:hypothetical protein